MRSAEEKTGCCSPEPVQEEDVVATSRDIASPYRRPTAIGYLLSGGFLLAVWWVLYLSLPSFSKWFTYSLLSLVPGSRLGVAVEFFVYDGPEGPPPPHPRGLRRGHRTLVLHPGALPEDPRGETGDGRERDGGPPGDRHPLLLLLGGSPLHRVRHLGRPARRDLLLPRLGADGERSRAGPSLRTVRVEDRGPLPRDGARDRDGVRLGDRTSRDGAARGGVGLRDPLRRGRRAGGRTPVVAGPGPVRHRRRPGHRRKGVAVRAGRDRRGGGDPRVRAGELHGRDHGGAGLVVGPAGGR